MGYSPNVLARGFRMKKTFTVGMVLPDLSNPHFPLMMKGAEEELRKNSYNLIIANSDGKLEFEREAINTLLSKHVDGILFIGSGYNRAVETLIEESGCPIVLLGRRWSKTLPSVSIATFSAMMPVFDFLYDEGHRSFLYLGGPAEVSSSIIERRLPGRRARIFQCGVKVTRGQFTYESGYERAFSELSDHGSGYDAVVCANDLIAFGAIVSCKALSIGVPEEISVTGFDNIFLSAQFTPALTTLDQNTYEIGRRAANLLLQYISGERKNKISFQLGTKLIVRESSRARGK
jgi:LacI family transcriptional regulator